MPQFIVTVPFTFTFQLPGDWPVTVAVTTQFHRLEDQLRDYDDVTVDPTTGIVRTTLKLAPYVYAHLSSGSFKPETPELADDPTVSRAAFTALYRAAEAHAEKLTPEDCSPIGVRVLAGTTTTAGLESFDAAADVTWEGSLEVTWTQSPVT